MSGLLPPLAVAPPGEAVTVYELIAAPFADGAVKLTAAWPSPPAAETAVGASGMPAGVTPLDADDAALVPTELVAVAVNV